MRELGRPVNDAMVRLVGSEQLVVRIDLDRDGVADEPRGGWSSTR